MSAFKIVSTVRELRIHLCQTNKSSKGVRDFIERYYVELKCHNPKLPILIRECSDVCPKLWARESKGKETCISLENLNSGEVLSKIKQFAS